MTGFGYARLDGHKVVEVDTSTDESLKEWAQWFEKRENRRVRHTLINKRRHIFVSTVFLGIDHGFQEKLWFETMIFGTSIDQAMDRYATWEEAEKGHEKMVRRARQARQIRSNSLKRKNLKNLSRRLRARIWDVAAPIGTK